MLANHRSECRPTPWDPGSPDGRVAVSLLILAIDSSAHRSREGDRFMPGQSQHSDRLLNDILHPKHSGTCVCFSHNCRVFVER